MSSIFSRLFRREDRKPNAVPTVSESQSDASSVQVDHALLEGERSLDSASRVLEEKYQTASRFEYSPLNSQAKEIRLLKLPIIQSEELILPAADCLVFELQHVSLADAPQFAALSYYWGDPTPSYRVMCNGRYHFIGKNLAQALYTMVCYFKKQAGLGETDNADKVYTYFWADALCVNQQDTAEKNSQIPLMKDIYSQAGCVFGYVGRPKSVNPWYAIRGLISLANAENLLYVFGRECEQLPDAPESVAQSFAGLCSSPWFGRTWVTQEILLPSNVLCLYGVGPAVASCTLYRLSRLILMAGSSEHPRSNPTRSVPLKVSAWTISQVGSWSDLKQLWAFKAISGGLDLVTALSNTWDTEVTDPRDKVFAVMGLLDDQSRSAIHVDYSEQTSAQQVYIEVAKYCIASGRAIQLLEHAGGTDHIPGIPTWVPDWSRKPWRGFYSHLYKASDSTGCTISLLDCGSKISVRGMAFDIVTSLSPAVTYPDAAIMDMSASPIRGNSVLVILDMLARQYHRSNQLVRDRYPTEESLDNAIFKTLTADQSTARSLYQRCTAKDRRCFDAWRAKLREMERDSSRSFEPDELNDNDWLPFKAMAGTKVPGRKLCVTMQGLFGLVPANTKLGDVVVVVFGSLLPFVLRPMRDSNDFEFELVGPCYIDGAMDGEVIQKARDTPGSWDEFVKDFIIR